MASPRSGWRGTITVRASESRFAAFHVRARSVRPRPGWVLAAKKTGRSRKARFNSFSAAASTGGGGESYFRLPVMAAFARRAGKALREAPVLRAHQIEARENRLG